MFFNTDPLPLEPRCPFCTRPTLYVMGEPFEKAYCNVKCFEEDKDKKQQATINKPAHYTSHPSGIECIEITEHMSFTLGNVIKYVWRADLKGGIEDLEKAQWYIAREIERRKSNAEK